MRHVEIVADNLEFEILSFSKWCSSTPIPKSFDDNLQPTNKNNTEGPSKILMPSTLAKYIGKTLLTVAASLIMYHNDVTRDYSPSNALTTRLRNAARDGRISDSRFPDATPEQVLVEWSKIILEDYRGRNSEISQASPDFLSMCQSINQQHVVQAEMLLILRKLQRSAAEGTTRLDQCVEELRYQQERSAELERELHKANLKLGCLKGVLQTPPPIHEDKEIPPVNEDNVGPIRKRLQYADATVRRDEGAMEQRIGASAKKKPRQIPSASAMTKKTVTHHVKNVNNVLTFGAQAKEVAESQGNKNVFVAVILTELYALGHLRGNDWKTITPPAQYTEKQSFRNTLELCEYVASEKEKEEIRSGKMEPEKLQNIASSIEKKCMTAMWEFEDSDPNLEVQLNRRKSASTQKRPTYLALGRRLRMYKTVLAKSSGKGKPIEEELRPRPPPDEQPTPPGNHSIRNFMVAKPNKRTETTTDAK